MSDVVFDAVSRLRQSTYGVDLDLSVDESTRTINVDMMMSEHPGNGAGTIAMSRLADRISVGQRKLEQWYMRFGFKKTGGRSEQGHVIMARAPSF